LKLNIDASNSKKSLGPGSANSLASNSPGTSSSASAISGGLFQKFGPATPRFHHRGQILSDLPSSPVGSNTPTTPKTSWFANVFNFKPETYYILSKYNLEETNAKLEIVFNVYYN
jgi:hypothetical protein